MKQTAGAILKSLNLLHNSPRDSHAIAQICQKKFQEFPLDDV